MRRGGVLEQTDTDDAQAGGCGSDGAASAGSAKTGSSDGSDVVTECCQFGAWLA